VGRGAGGVAGGAAWRGAGDGSGAIVIDNNRPRFFVRFTQCNVKENKNL
jgi:hypothetical protein